MRVAPVAHRQRPPERAHEGSLRRDDSRSRLVDQWTGLLSARPQGVPQGRRHRPDCSATRSFPAADQVWVFAQTVIPDSTLCVHPWLGELGDSPSGEILSELSGVERSSYEYAWLPAEHALTRARAARHGSVARGIVGAALENLAAWLAACSRKRRSCPPWAVHPRAPEAGRPCGCHAQAPNCCSGSPSAGDGSSIGCAFIPGPRTSCRGFLGTLGDYVELTRLNRPIGIWLLLWPTLWAVWIAGRGKPDPASFIIFVCGTVLMRSAGCAVNDYADRSFDPHVARTAARPLAAGRVSPRPRR